MERWLLAKWVRPRAAGLHCAAYRWAGCREATLRAASRWTQQGRAQRAEAAEAGGGDDDGGGPGPGPGTGTGMRGVARRAGVEWCGAHWSLQSLSFYGKQCASQPRPPPDEAEPLPRAGLVCPKGA